jgi:transposase
VRSVVGLTNAPHQHSINRLKLFRGLATRYDKQARNYHAFIALASLMFWLPRE